MISEFRRMKFLYLFQAFLDVDFSGSVDQKDFELAADKIAKLRGWTPDDSKYKETQAALRKIWKELEKTADTNNDGTISVDEWMTMWEKFSKNPSSPFEWQKLNCKFFFELEDASGDGAIDIEEFTTVHESFGLPKEDSSAAFKFMTRGMKEISWEEFQELWKEYFISENPMDRGNFILGAATY